MKNILIMMCLLLLTTGAQAQTGAAKKAVERIREQYAEAKAKIEYNNTSEETRNQLTATISHMVPAIGHQDKTVTYYFFTDYDEDAGDYISTPYFITVTYNVAARKFYEEYLLKAGSDIIFAYLSGDSSGGGGERFEARYYWENDQLVHQQLKGDEMTADHFAYDQGKRLVEAFRNLVP